jgi:hypothetical protein
MGYIISIDVLIQWKIPIVVEQALVFQGLEGIDGEGLSDARTW